MEEPTNIFMYHTIGNIKHNVRLSVGVEVTTGKLYMPSITIIDGDTEIYWDNSAFIFGDFYDKMMVLYTRSEVEYNPDDTILHEISHLINNEFIKDMLDMLNKAKELKWHLTEV